MDKITKVLKKLQPKERKSIKDILTKIESQTFQGLDIKKLRARGDIFRVRKGAFRIIYQKKEDTISILTIERRSDKTYKNI